MSQVALTEAEWKALPVGSVLRYCGKNFEILEEKIVHADTSVSRKVRYPEGDEVMCGFVHVFYLVSMPKKDNGVRYVLQSTGYWFTDLEEVKAAASVNQTIYEVRPFLNVTKAFVKVDK